MKMRITKEYQFEAAHALDHHSGKCHDIHGHSYHLKFTCIGKLITKKGSPDEGMVADFALLSKTVRSRIEPEFDHRLILNIDSRFKGIELYNARIRYVNYQPTCENILREILEILTNALPNLIIEYGFLRETPTSYAECYKSDNE